MLSLQLKTGDYMTIGGDVVVQLDHISGDRCKLMIEAPRDMTILRGEVLERNGEDRPLCLHEPQSAKARKAKRTQKFAG